MTEIIFENETTTQLVKDASRFKAITVISTGGSTDTVVNAGTNSARLQTIGTITGGVGAVTVDVLFPLVQVVPGTDATIDASGRST